MTKYQAGDITKSLFGYVDAKSSLSEIYAKKVVCSYKKPQVSSTSSKSDVQPVTKSKKCVADKPIVTVKETSDENENTIFIGNLPIETTKKALKKLVNPYGTIITLRFRSIPLLLSQEKDQNLHTSSTDDDGSGAKKKLKHLTLGAAARSAQALTDPGRFNKNAYVRFEESVSVGRAIEALNGQIYQGRHLRVDRVQKSSRKEVSGVKYDKARTIFLGNLPFESCEEEDLWQTFQEKAGLAVEALRIIRTSGALKGVGCGFVLFKEKDSVDLALMMNGKLRIKGRTVRIKRCLDRTVQKGSGERTPLGRGGSKFAGKRTNSQKDRTTPSQDSVSGSVLKINKKSDRFAKGGRGKKKSTRRLDSKNSKEMGKGGTKRAHIHI